MSYGDRDRATVPVDRPHQRRLGAARGASSSSMRWFECVPMSSTYSARRVRLRPRHGHLRRDRRSRSDASSSPSVSSSGHCVVNGSSSRRERRDTPPGCRRRARRRTRVAGSRTSAIVPPGAERVGRACVCGGVVLDPVPRLRGVDERERAGLDGPVLERRLDDATSVFAEHVRHARRGFERDARRDRVRANPRVALPGARADLERAIAGCRSPNSSTASNSPSG